MHLARYALASGLLFSAFSAASAQSFFDPDRSSEIGFGRSIAVSDGIVFVGEPETYYTPGSIHMYRLEDGEWREAGRLTLEDARPADGFGFAIAVRGDRLIASALDPQRRGTGHAYVFERNDSREWQQTAELAAPQVAEGDAYGAALAIEGDRAIVTAPQTNNRAGTAYMFERSNDGSWSFTSTLEPADPEEGQRFGSRVALTGNHTLIAAPDRESFKGAVYHFAFDGTWFEIGLLPTDGLDESDVFGASVALGDGYAAVGAPGADDGAGQVRTYAYDDATGTWQRGATLRAFDGGARAAFGASLAIAEHTLWIGAAGAARRSGAAYAYLIDPATTSWTAGHKFLVDGISSGDAFGSTMAADGDLAAVAAPGEDFGAGAAAVFLVEAGAEWTAVNRIESDLEALEGVAGAQVNCSEGLAASFGCESVDLVSLLPLADMGASRGAKLNDVWGWTDTTTGHDYAIVGMHDKASFVDVTDPSNPRYLGNLPMTEGANGAVWRDIKVYRGHAFIVADGAGQHGMQVFDLTRLRDVNEPVEFDADALYENIASAHNIVINEATGFAYVVGARGGGETCGGGLHMINIQDPLHPAFVGCFADSQTGRAGTGYSHDAQCIVYNGPDEEYRDSEICFGLNETALSIADVSDKSNPLAISRASYPSVAYAHQGWITDDHRFFFSDDELDEVSGQVDHTRTLVWDISDLDDPILVNEYFASTNSTDHNLYVRGNRMYQSNNTAGLRVLDISDPANPVEIGHFDTFPSGDDAAGFHGNWSNYPFFDSGVILATGRREGLFILKERQELVP